MRSAYTDMVGPLLCQVRLYGHVHISEPTMTIYRGHMSESSSSEGDGLVRYGEALPFCLQSLYFVNRLINETLNSEIKLYEDRINEFRL